MSFGFDTEFINGFLNENTTQYGPMIGVGRYPIHPYFSKKLTGVNIGIICSFPCGTGRI